MRANYSQLAPESFKAMMALEGTLTLDTTIKELVKLHISQINGCTFCTDMHVKEAKLHGERELRLYHLPVWRESPLFTDKERAALEWAEKLTRLEGSHVSDADYAQVSAQFDEKELAELTFVITVINACVITVINAWNRLGVAYATDPGSADKMMGLDKAGLQ